MPVVLIVDDSGVDRKLAARILVESGFDVEFANDGQAALDFLAANKPDIVLTDLQMPILDGLALVRQVAEDFIGLPIVLMTGQGSEELAVEALKSGAASYVPKRNLTRDLATTVKDVLSISDATKQQQRVQKWMTEVRSKFELGPLSNGAADAVHLLIGHVERSLLGMGVCDENELLRVGTALHEAFVNAIDHGNLELNSDLREEFDSTYHDLRTCRLSESPYCDRKIFVEVHITRENATIRIGDQGRGFDPACLPDPTDPANLERPSGRGLMLIRTFMDDVTFNPTGNQITMVKHRVVE